MQLEWAGTVMPDQEGGSRSLQATQVVGQAKAEAD